MEFGEEEHPDRMEKMIRSDLWPKCGSKDPNWSHRSWISTRTPQILSVKNILINPWIRSWGFRRHRSHDSGQIKPVSLLCILSTCVSFRSSLVSSETGAGVTKVHINGCTPAKQQVPGFYLTGRNQQHLYFCLCLFIYLFWCYRIRHATALPFYAKII